MVFKLELNDNEDKIEVQRQNKSNFTIFFILFLTQRRP